MYVNVSVYFPVWLVAHFFGESLLSVDRMLINGQNLYINAAVDFKYMFIIKTAIHNYLASCAGNCVPEHL